MALSAGQRELLGKLLATGLSSAVVFFLMRLLLKQLEPGHEKKARAMAIVRSLLPLLFSLRRSTPVWTVHYVYVCVYVCVSVCLCV